MHVGFVVVFARVSSIGFTAKTRVIYLKGIEKCSSAAHKAVRLLRRQDLVTIFTTMLAIYGFHSEIFV